MARRPYSPLVMMPSRSGVILSPSLTPLTSTPARLKPETASGYVITRSLDIIKIQVKAKVKVKKN